MNIKEITNRLRISPNEMQQTVVDTLLGSHEDTVVLSPTGSGKTLAYLLPLTQLIDTATDEVQAVVVVPGRELALQSATVLQDMACGVRACACYGGRAAMDEHRMLKKVRPHIIFATPGRLNDHLDKQNIQSEHVKYMVIDEFDKCLDMGFYQEMSALFDKLSKDIRLILLSATDAAEIPDFMNSRALTSLKGKAGMGFQKIDFSLAEEQTSERVTIYEVRSMVKDKLETLSRLLRSIGGESSIVFLNHRDAVERTADYLAAQGFYVSAFHGGLDQRAREDALYKFSNGSANVFVSTDLGSRGLDIPDIQNIIHYHLPESEDGYIHRVGRTARWDKSGKTYFVLGPEEQIPAYVDATVAEYLIPDEHLPAPAAPKMATIYIGKGKKDKISKGDIVGYLCKKGGLKATDIGRIDVKDYYAYAAIDRKRLLGLLNQVKGEKIKGIRTIVEEIR
jgi:Superfamily II DNA and RNA helicases